MVTFRFGAFTMDTDARELVGSAGQVRLSPKAFGLLEHLVRERPRAVPKHELLDELWPDVHVEEQNVKNLVVEIRRMLGDDASDPRFIRNVFGCGYAFVGAAWEVSPIRESTTAHLYSPDADMRYPLHEGENLIGRDNRCSVVLALSGVSKLHAKLTIDRGQFSIEDLGSKNGTWVNGERIHTRAEVKDGDSIRTGIWGFLLRDTSRDEPTTTVIPV